MSVVDRTTTEAMDAAMMARCIELSKTSKQVGEFPFACVIAKDGKVVVETLNRVARGGGCTLYTKVEPCVMCSFPMRETRISRVVYSIGSRLMGGDSKWDILADPQLSKVMPEAFGEAPEVVRGYMRPEAEKAWRAWNPLIWGVIRYRGCFGPPPKAEPMTPAAPRRRSILQTLFAPHG